MRSWPKILKVLGGIGKEGHEEEERIVASAMALLVATVSEWKWLVERAVGDFCSFSTQAANVSGGRQLSGGSK